MFDTPALNANNIIMNNFRIQRFKTSVIIPVNNDTENSAVVEQLNGVLKGITLVAPALTGTAYTLSILGQRGEVLFTKAALVEAVNTYIGIDANNHPLSIPLSLMGVAPVRIKSTGSPDATGVLTFQNDGPITNNKIVTIGDQVYRLRTSLAQAFDVLIEPDVAASAVLTWANGGTNVTDGKKVVAGAVEYTFKTALTDGIVANEVLIGSDGDDSLLNLKKAVNAEAGGGVKYGSATVVNPDVTAGAVTSHAITFTAKVAGTSGNSLAKSTDEATLDWDGVGAVFTNGAWSGDSTLTNLLKALTLVDTGGESGVKYHAGTVANAYVTGAPVASHALTVTAVDGVDDPTDVDTTTDDANLTWGAATLVGGGEAVARTFEIDLLIDRG